MPRGDMTGPPTGGGRGGGRGAGQGGGGRGVGRGGGAGGNRPGQARVGSAFVPVAEPGPRTRQAHRVPALNAPVAAPL